MSSRQNAPRGARPDDVRRTAREPAPRAVRGAASPQRQWRDQLDSWLDHHRRIALDSGLRLLRTPLASLMTALVMGIALALPAALILVLSNLQGLSGGWEDAARINVYLVRATTESQALDLRRQWQAQDDIRDVQFISKGQALDSLRSRAGLQRALDQLNENPLPHTLVVTPASSDPVQVEAVVERLKATARVEQVQLDMAWLQRLQAIIDLMGRAAWALALILALGVVLVIGNTIRLAIESRRDEIVVVKLVGGTDAFVRRPFLYTGAWFGLLGATLALILLAVAGSWLASPLAQLVALYGGSFALEGLGFADALLILICGILAGWVGAWLAVQRHLGDIEPT
ncbi:MAG: permease-like cell division protein FtsX [Gammaproteobacteria bacterium]|nr:permease-like cell division protein FtsX [Gammaproteobacteria bacterium]